MSAGLKPGERVRIMCRPSVKAKYWGLTGVVLERCGLGAQKVRRVVVVRTDDLFHPIDILIDVRNVERRAE